MSRFFNGGTALDSITFAAGNGPPDQGPITVAVLARASATNFTGWLLHGHDSGGFAKWSMLLAATGTAKLFMENDFGAGGPAPGTDWCWLVGTKASGSVLPRWHLKNITTGAPWVHVDGTATVPDNTGVSTTLILGNHSGGGAGDSWRGRIAAGATWASVLGDAAVEAACTLSANDLNNAAPGWGVLLNQSSVATPVNDFTGGGGNQIAISGTAVDADEPPGWSYTIGGVTPVQSTLTSKWLVRTKVSTLLTGKWTVFQKVTSSIRSLWNVFTNAPTADQRYLLMQRRMTQALIEDDPTTAQLIPRIRVETSTGGYTLTDGAPRVAQTFKLSLLNSDQRPTITPTSTTGGIERIMDFHLIGPWNMSIEVNDYWVDAEGTKYIVESFTEGWGYMTKAQVSRHVPKEANP